MIDEEGRMKEASKVKQNNNMYIHQSETQMLGGIYDIHDKISRGEGQTVARGGQYPPMGYL